MDSQLRLEFNRKLKLDDENVWHDLPDELLAEILTRLPLKSKSCSPDWNSTSPSCSLSKSWAFTLLDWNDRFQSVDIPTLSSGSFSDDDELLKFFMLPQSDPHRYKALASSHGLLLCSDFQDSTLYYVCNPLTKQWICIPPDHNPDYGHRFEVGFATKIDQGGKVVSYKLVKVLFRYKLRDIHIRIFASETGKWTDFNVECPRNGNIKFNSRPICLNGTLHWCTVTGELFVYQPYKTPDQFRLIELPVKGVVGHYNKRLCEASEGRLHYFQISKVDTNKVVRLWVLEDYDTGKWELKHNTRLYGIRRVGFTPNLDHIYPIAFHPFNSSIVYLCWNRNKHTAIFTYDIRSKMLKLVFDDLVSTWIELGQYSVLPLVLAPWTL